MNVEIPAPDGYHWMSVDGKPVLMEGPADHEGASDAMTFDVIEEHAEKGAAWDKIYQAILGRTGNKELAAATATARAGAQERQHAQP